jgi:hypothetical protein
VYRRAAPKQRFAQSLAYPYRDKAEAGKTANQ